MTEIKIKENPNWPDSVRLEMIEHSENYYDDPEVYQYGYYDGYQKAYDILINETNDLKEQLETGANQYAKSEGEKYLLIDALKNMYESCNPVNIERDKMFGGKIIAEYYSGGKGTPSDEALCKAKELLDNIKP